MLGQFRQLPNRDIFLTSVFSTLRPLPLYPREPKLNFGLKSTSRFKRESFSATKSVCRHPIQLRVQIHRDRLESESYKALLSTM